MELSGFRKFLQELLANRIMKKLEQKEELCLPKFGIKGSSFYIF